MRLIVPCVFACVALGLAAPSLAAVPKASDYHSLLVLATKPETILLGTHDGIYRSADGGKRWRLAGKVGDAMNLTQAGNTILMGGHNVFVASTDGGKSWHASTPSGLPSMDVHGLAADPRNPNIVYAQIAGTGLYISTDGGRSFKLLSAAMKGGMMPVAVTSSGSLVVGDMSQGIFISSTGKRWLHTATGMVMGIAVDPKNAKRVVATGRGIAISSDGGHTWGAALPSKTMFGPVAWSPVDAKLVYAVGYDRSFWRSADAGKSWHRVR